MKMIAFFQLLAWFLIISASPNVAAQIQISSPFQVNTALPIDTRAIAADLTARDAISPLRRYEGLIVYVTSEETNYQLVGGIDNVNWIELSGAGGIAEWQTATLYEVGGVVWVDADKNIYVANTEHTSAATFAEDVANWDELSSSADKLDKFPAETNDNRLVRTDVNGNAVQGSLAALDDAGALSGLTQLDVDNVRIDGSSVTTTATDEDLVLAGDGTGRVKIKRDAVEFEAGSNNPELGELMLYPSFEEGHEGVATNATATLVANGFHGKQALSIAFNAGGGTYIVDKSLPADGSRDNVTHKVSCAITATAAGGKFLVRSNGATVAEIDVDDITGEPQEYVALTSGTTSIGWGVSHDDETLVIDKCSITNDFTPSPSKSCNGDFGCENEFSAKVSSTGVVSDENLGWLDGDCTNPSTGKYVCSYVSGLFGLTPNVVVTANADFTDSNSINCRLEAASNTSFTVQCNRVTTDSVEINSAFAVYALKQGSDFVKTSEKGVIVTGSSAGAVLVVTNEGTSVSTTVGVGTITAPFDTVKRSEGFSWSTVNNEATVLKSGRYSLSPEVTIWNNATSGTTTGIYFEVDRGSGYTSLPGDDSRCLVYSVDTTAAGENPNCRFIADLRAGDKVRLRVTATHASTFIRNNTVYPRMTIEPVLNNETVAALLSTQYVSGGVEVETGNEWDGQPIFRRCYELTSNITVSGTVLASIETGLKPVGVMRYGSAFYSLLSSGNGAAGTDNNHSYIAYNTTTGAISCFISVGATIFCGAGTRFCMEYTK